MTLAASREVVAFLYNDLSGVTRGRMFPPEQLDRRRRVGVGWVPANQALTCFGAIADPNPWGPLGDLRLMADKDTEVRVDLWEDATPLHFFLCDATEVDGGRWDSCARTLLKDAIAELYEGAGVSIAASFEEEFTLSLPGSADFVPGAFTLEALRLAEPFGPLLVAALEQAGIEVETILPEYGERQWELSCTPQAGLRAADQAVVCREIVREVARRLNGRATFAPMIDPEQTGNGLHVHFSFRGDDGEVHGYDPERPAGVGDLAGRFAAGVLAHLPAVCAFTAPTVVSYLRLVPHRWSAGYGFVGRQNREAAIRVVHAESAADFNLEFRAADSGCCPHLALAVLIFAGLDGIRSLGPAEVWQTDPADLSNEEREREGVVALPSSLECALEAAERDYCIRACVPPTMLEGYLAMKRTELALLEDADDKERCARYANVY